MYEGEINDCMSVWVIVFSLVFTKATAQHFNVDVCVIVCVREEVCTGGRVFECLSE